MGIKQKKCVIHCCSLYTDVVLFFFSFFVLFENIGEHAIEASARELAAKNEF